MATDNHLTYDVCALEDSKILSIDYGKLLADADFVKIAGVISNNLLQFHVAHARALQAHIYHLAQPTTREKLLAYLTDESKKAGSNTFHIRYDRQELADYLAVERSAMCAELSRMQKDNLLTYRKNDFTLKKK
ncbi:MAG: Crp/Fnr family transcriptional regulator [Lachnospiraceae bacterium]|nr:Crp/Fnr family transcriptional regulator [Lachnospiraceae bacterium]